MNDHSIHACARAWPCSRSSPRRRPPRPGAAACRRRTARCGSPSSATPGTASTAQYDVGKQMAAFHTRFPFELRDHGRRQHLRHRPPRRLPGQVRAALRQPRDGEREVLRRRSATTTTRPAATTRTWNMGGQRFYTFRASGGAGKLGSPRRALLRAGQQLHGQAAARLAGARAGHSGLGVEDRRSSIIRSIPRAAARLVARPARACSSPSSSSTASTWSSPATTTSTSASSRSRASTTSCPARAARCARATSRDRTGLTDRGFDTDFTFMLVEIDGQRPALPEHRPPGEDGGRGRGQAADAVGPRAGAGAAGGEPGAGAGRIPGDEPAADARAVRDAADPEDGARAFARRRGGQGEAGRAFSRSLVVAEAVAEAVAEPAFLALHWAGRGGCPAAFGPVTLAFSAPLLSPAWPA